MRLIPFVERNFNIIELGPKGTGKSHIYSEFSPHGQLISGGEVTVPKLFVNNSNGRIGLVGFWDVVAFDEFAGREKKANKALVDIMKNYMANKSFSRGVNPMGAEASFAFVGNTDHNVPFMLKNSDLFEALPPQFHDSAFIDRLHAYLPGWEVDVIRGEMFTSGFGFIVDYLAEILRHLRSEDFSNRADKYFHVSQQISTRDRDAIFKTLSGYLKLLFPNGGETEEDVEDLLRLAMESRKRVKDQLARIDSTYPDVDFHYTGSDGQKRPIATVEEEEFPQFYHLKPALDPKEQRQGADVVLREVNRATDGMKQPDGAGSAPTLRIVHSVPAQPKLEEGHKVFTENRKGISYDSLFGPYIDGAKRIIVTDPYIRFFYQIRNMMEFVEMVIRRKAPEDQVAVHLVTGPDDGNVAQQRELLESISTACLGSGVDFTWAFDTSGTAHARDIVTDTGWKIVLDRGLDIFQAPVKSGGFSLGDRLQEHRMAKGFYVTYVKLEK
ncbi:BREX system Lon protease-like protein BrxL [Thalassobius vesicularis]|uniref:BREX system Lon protease-like protein BrxL n=1 Tax=Thalassobius vesicularis TaxID=1294297 RepID=UPI001FE8F8BF|nr:BREX system Lon protease-like protein BrxL [Thalassobius vesicularis]